MTPDEISRRFREVVKRGFVKAAETERRTLEQIRASRGRRRRGTHWLCPSCRARWPVAPEPGLPCLRCGRVPR